MPPSFGDDTVVNITVHENEPLALECDVEAFPLPTITWFKNSRPLLLRPGVVVSEEGRRLDILWSQVKKCVFQFNELSSKNK